ncbi:hypothetical protein OJAV_G00134640 [Oryzias javanicus]|uniref:Uncharacterized protein n=1 Tax=Oryzias javanicus TaxID=123683 RepID=A0A437CR11_ORYJA|nr:hypothetical protein OJAV_G00134640 [Oryzias javanicus]
MDFCLTEFLHHRAAANQPESRDPGGRGQRPHKSSTRPTGSTEPEPEPGPAQDARPRSSMQHARGAVFVVLAALALSSVGVSSQSDRDQDQFQNQDLDLELRHHRLLQRARSAGLLSQDWSKRAIENMLARMSDPEAEPEREAEMAAKTSTGKASLPADAPPS